LKILFIPDIVFGEYSESSDWWKKCLVFSVIWLLTDHTIIYALEIQKESQAYLQCMVFFDGLFFTDITDTIW